MSPSIRSISAYTLLLLSLWVVGCKGSRQTVQPPAKPTQRTVVEVEETTLQRECLLIEAKMQQQAGNDQQAMERYLRLLAQDDHCAAAHYELAQMLADQGYLDSALYHSQRAAALDPRNEWYQLLLAGIYEQRYDRKAVAATWEHIVAARPDRREYYYQLSNAYLQVGDADRAIDALNRMEKRWGLDEEVSLQKKKIWEAAGKPQNALREVERLARSMPNETRYSAMVAEAYMKQKDYRSAKPYYDQIARQHPDDEYIHISLANYYKLTGDPQKALEELTIGFCNPGLSCSSKMQILGSFYTNEEFYDTYAPATFDLVDTLVRHCDADTVEYALFYADVQMRRERYAEALPWIRLHLAHDSSQYEAWEALLICEWMMDGDNSLEHDAQVANSLFPFHLLPYYLLAVSAEKRHDYTTALALLEKGKQLGFRNGYLEVECYSLMGECHYRLGQWGEAWKCFDRCLALQPDNVYVMNNYAYYLSETPDIGREQLLRAEQLSRRTIEAQPDNATFLDTYAWILHQLHRDREALPYMRRAIDKDESHSETLQQHYQAILSHQ